MYGQLLDPNFVFVYRNYDLSIDVTWGRDDEMRTTYGLFQNAQKLDLIWNNIISTAADSTHVNVVRGFNLTLMFNPERHRADRRIRESDLRTPACDRSLEDRALAG